MKKRVFTDFANLEFCITEPASEILESFSGKVSHSLYRNMRESLQGFQDDMQLIMAVNLRDAVCYGWERYTLLKYVDELLKSFYLEIDKDVDRI